MGASIIESDRWGEGDIGTMMKAIEQLPEDRQYD